MTEPITLDFATVKRLVTESITDKGEDHVYTKEGGSCKYVHDVKSKWEYNTEDYDVDFTYAGPGCLVGEVLHRAGVPLELLYRVNTEGVQDAVDSLAYYGVLGTMERDVTEYLTNLQASQDRGAPWGLANEAALKGDTLVAEYDEDGERTGKWITVK